VADPILKETTHPDIGEMIASRGRRAWDLYLSRHQRIQHIGEDSYSVPGSGSKHYRVRYGAGVEGCECVDFSVHGGQVPCRHLITTGLMFAARRREPKARTISVASDPFAAGASAGSSKLKERLRHELMDDEERQELRDRVLRLRKESR
jgi:hypothetical protein